MLSHQAAEGTPRNVSAKYIIICMADPSEACRPWKSAKFLAHMTCTNRFCSLGLAQWILALALLWLMTMTTLAMTRTVNGRSCVICSHIIIY